MEIPLNLTEEMVNGQFSKAKLYQRLQKGQWRIFLTRCFISSLRAWHLSIESRWEEFNLTDSLATRIKFLNKRKKVLADLMIGKLDFKQPDKAFKRL